MKVLILGATGLLAKPVIHHLHKDGHALRLFSRSISDSDFTSEFEIMKGDVFNGDDLGKAMQGCEAVHISLSKVNEASATMEIVQAAKSSGIQLISYVSGCTVSEENRWFPMIDNKYNAEQTIMNSGIPYMIFRPTWFFESLGLMVRGGKAMMLGKQPNQYRWIAADDFASMLATAYRKELSNSVFYILGKKSYLMKDLLTEYCRQLEPDIKNVSALPISMAKLIAGLTGKKELKAAARLFSYFEKVKEQGDPEETYKLLGEPQISFEQWLESRKSEQFKP